MRVAVVDYGAGNLLSVANALSYLEADFFISNQAELLDRSDKLIFPGVGHAKSAMDNLRASGIDDFLRSYAASGRVIFGICLGSQLFLEHTEEGDAVCLSFMPGSCKRFAKNGVKVPQIGWNNVYHTGHYLFNGIPDGSAFYFVHSYYTIPKYEENVLCTATYALQYAAGLVKDNLLAVQFHPERSGRLGLKMLANFLEAKY
ncbi:MAG: imidazole glycerol phosphate synthase subunit HisH [Deferribacteraceae bacterium]|jgi:glutamine amidotransferase|nr:imidazole glycerol phosphate synthase subunit HisH [Deferribacteraceae bacterium]